MAPTPSASIRPDDRGKHWYFVTNIKDANPSPRVIKFIQPQRNGSLSVARKAKHMAFTRMGDAPPQRGLSSPSDRDTDLAGLRTSASANESCVRSWTCPRPNTFNCSAREATPMQMWILLAAGVRRQEEMAQLVYLVHAGPQGGRGRDGLEQPLEPASVAAQGYVAPCRTRAGKHRLRQQYVDEICGDWGRQML